MDFVIKWFLAFVLAVIAGSIAAALEATDFFQGAIFGIVFVVVLLESNE